MNDSQSGEFRYGWPVVAGTFLILTLGFVVVLVVC